MWIKKKTFMQEYDYDDNEIRSKIQRKIWLKGIHYAIIDGRQRFNKEEIDAWITQEVLGQEEIPSKSAINTKGKHIAKPSKKGQTKQTSPMQLV